MSDVNEMRIGGLEVVDIQGMGDVGISYKAKKSETTDEFVFLKVLKWDFPTTGDRLQTEFALRRASFLNHTNLAKIIDVGVTNAGKVWYTREFLESQKDVSPYSSINSVLPELDETGACLVLLQLFDALDYLARNGLRHGNLKSSNIWIVKNTPSQEQNLWKSGRKSKSQFTVKFLDYAICPPPRVIDSESLLPSYDSCSDDLKAIGKIIIDAYFPDLHKEHPSMSEIREHVPQALQVTVSRLLGISRNKPFESFKEAISSLDTISPSRNIEFKSDIIPKDTKLQKDSERSSFLLDMFSDSSEKGRFVIIDGDEGCGKSSLVREFAQKVWSNGSLASVISCSNYHSPADGFVEFLEDIEFGLSKSNPALLEHYSPVIERLKGDKLSSDPYLITKRSSLFEGFVCLLKELSHIKPICLIIEDLEQASEFTLSLLSSLQSDISEFPFLLIGTINHARIRSSQQKLIDGLMFSDNTHKLQISPLDYSGTVEHIRQSLSSDDLSEDICARFFESTGGNILKLNELLRITINEGILTSHGDTHNLDLRRFADIAENSDAQSLISKEIMQLKQDERSLCQIIAMIGGRIKLSTLTHVIESTSISSIKGNAQLANVLWGLVAKGILRRRPEAGGYHFSLIHGAYTETLVNSIPFEERKRYNDELVESLTSKRIELSEKDIKAAIIALKGSNPTHAMSCTIKAQTFCSRQFAHEERLFFLTKLLQMTPETSVEFRDDCLFKISEECLAVGDFDEALKRISHISNPDIKCVALKTIVLVRAGNQDPGLFFDKVIPRIDEITDPLLKQELLAEYLKYMSSVNPQKALEFSVNCSLSSENLETRIDCLLTSSRINAAMANFSEAEKAADDALAQAKDSKNKDNQGRVITWRIQLTQMSGNASFASRLIRRSEGMMEGCWDVGIKSKYHKLASSFFMENNEYTSALRHLYQLVSTLNKSGAKKSLGKALFSLGRALSFKGEDIESSRSIEKARRIAEEVGDNQTLGRSLTYIGLHQLVSESFDQAQVSLSRAEKILDDQQDEEYLAKIAEGLGKLGLIRGDVAQAKAHSKKLSELANHSKEDNLLAISNRLEGAINSYQEKWDKAEEKYTNALSIFQKLKEDREVNMLKVDLADMFVKQGDFFRALSKLSEARMFFDEEGGTKELRRISKMELEIDRELGKYGEDYRNLRMLLEISKALVVVTNLNELLPMIVDMALKVTNAERGFIMLVSKSGVLDFRCGRNQKKEDLNPDEFAFSSTVTDTVLTEKTLVSITDTETDEKFKTRESVVGLSLRSIMCAPLKIGERVIGLIYVDSQVPTFYFSKKNAEFFEALCSHAATGISHAELSQKNADFDALMDENKTLKDLMKLNKSSKARQVTKLETLVNNAKEKLRQLNQTFMQGSDSSNMSIEILSGIDKTLNIIDQMKSNGENYE